MRLSKSNHSIWKNLFVLGSFEYLERPEGKLKCAYSFMIKFSEIAMCY